jgi:hypothetical protein
MGRGGLLVQKCDRNCPAESVIAPTATPHHNAEAAQIAPQVVHTPPDLPPCPAPPAAEIAPVAEVHPPPAAELAPALDLDTLARDLVEEYGAAWARAKRAARLSYGVGGRGDSERVEALHVAYTAAAEAYRAEQKQETAARQVAQKRAEWEAYRAELRALDDKALLCRVKLLARQHQNAVKNCYSRRGWYAVRFTQADEERRRRGLDIDAIIALENDKAPRRRRREGFETRKANAAAAAGRLGEIARDLRGEDTGGRVQAELWAAVDAERFRRGDVGGLTLKGAPPVVAEGPAIGGVCSSLPAEPTPSAPPQAHQWGSPERATLAERIAALKAGKVAACAD